MDFILTKKHWEKVEMRDGSFQLVKRNASDFAIDGGTGCYKSKLTMDYYTY